MATTENLDNQIWQISTRGFGVVVQGLASLRQSLHLCIVTTKGTDPLRPEFGSRVLQYQDKPPKVAVPNIKREIIEAVETWEKRVRIVGIRHSFPQPYNPAFEIFYRVVDTEIIDRVLLDLESGISPVETPSELVLQAMYPENPAGYRYSISLLRNGAQVFPVAPPDGFGNLDELFAWAKQNWGYWGRFYRLADKLVLYMNAEGVTSANMAISVKPIIRFSAVFPALLAGQVYRITFTQNGVAGAPANYNTLAAALNGMQVAYPNQQWFIEFVRDLDGSIFTAEFSDEFDIPADAYNLIGISNEAGFVGAVTIEAVNG